MTHLFSPISTMSVLIVLAVTSFLVTLASDVTPENTDDSDGTEKTRTLEVLMIENERLLAQVDALMASLQQCQQQDTEEQEPSAESNESHSRSRGLSRGKRGSGGCDGGTVSQWACGSQCIYKLKGLCGLSLRAMCHC